MLLDKTNTAISKKLHEIIHLSGLKRWFCLMEILVMLAESKELSSICKTSLIGNNEKESKRLSVVMNWILQEYEKEIRIAEAAAIDRKSVV